MKKRLMIALAGASTLAAAAGAVHAREAAGTEQRPQAQREQQTQASAPASTLRDTELRNALSAHWLLNAEVRGEGDVRLGKVDEILIDRNGRVSAIGVGVGGVLGLAQNVIRVPWDAVQIAHDVERVRVPVSRENVKRFALFDRAERRGREWRVTELLAGRAALRDNEPIGAINDFLVTRDGRVSAVVVSEAAPFDQNTPYDQNIYALPFRPQGLQANNDYVAGVGRDEFRRLRPFDYRALGILPHDRAIGATAAPRDVGATAGAEPRGEPRGKQRPDSR